MVTTINWWKALKKDWKALTRPNKVATILSIIAILVTILNGILSWQQTNQQNNINSGIATFSANAQSTSVASFQQQIELQNTQIAMQIQMDEFTKWQMMPLIRVVNHTQPVLVLESITVDESSAEKIVIGSGVINIILSNDGGGGASLIEINLVTSSNNEAFSKRDLSIADIAISKADSRLPMQIEGQSPARFDITVIGKVSSAEDIKGKSSLELGKLWSDKLRDADISFEFTFSNTEKLLIPLSSISLDIQFQKLFSEVTDKAERLRVLQRVYDSLTDKNSDEGKVFKKEIEKLNLELYGSPISTADQLMSQLSEKLANSQVELNVARKELREAEQRSLEGDLEALKLQLKLQEHILKLEKERAEQIALLQSLQEEKLRRQKIAITTVTIVAIVIFVLAIRLYFVKKRAHTEAAES